MKTKKGTLLKLRLQQAMRRELWIAIGPPLLLVALAFAVTVRYVKPAPPKQLVLAVGSDEGGARYYAKRYKEILARNGVTLELRETAGSAANLRLLEDSDSDVDVAFVQSGTEPKEGESELVSLGSLNYVPLWVFYRSEAPIDDPRELRGLRIAVGAENSATQALARKLLAVNGADGAPSELVSLDRTRSVEALKGGQIDAAFLVSPAESPAIQKLATEPGLRLMSFARGEAYARRFPFLTRLVLPRGIFDLAKDVPSKDVTLLAPTANLVARSSLHPALAYLLMRAASEVHGSAGLLDKAGEFPAPREGGFALSSEAKRYYTSGVPFLQRFLPFWAANLVDRLWVMLLPLIAVLVPLVRVVPSLYRWRIRSRIYRWYARLKEVELELEDDPSREKLQDMVRRLDEIELAVNGIPTPLSYSENLYVFREHVDLIRRRILYRLAGGTEPAAAARMAM